MAHISTEFDTKAEKRVPERDVSSKFTSVKIQDGGGRHLEIS